MGRAVKTIKTIDGISYTTTTAFDPVGNVDYMIYPDNETLDYVYDYPAGNLRNAGGYATYNTSSYNALGQLGSVSYGNTVTTAYTYHTQNNRLTSIKTNKSNVYYQNIAYEYDHEGNLKKITDNNDSNRTQNFTYDELERLTQAQSNAYGTITYQYNEIGNMTYNSQVGTYTYGTKPHAVTSAGANTYSYDANGNMTSGAGRTIAYNYDNMPLSINGAAFLYDFSGQRVKKNSTVYIGKLYECTSGVCTKYVFAGTNRIAMKKGSTINYYQTDHLGSSSIITDALGNKAEELYYYPFGKTRINSGSVNLKHKFTGQEMDDETGLYYYGARYYDPALGRFISPDSVVQDYSDPQTLNRYSYCRNNPIILTDPSGNIFIIDDIIIVAATYVIANAAVIAEGAAIGAVLGGASAAVTGGNVLQGMALGAVSGAVFAGVGGFIGDSITYAAVPGIGPPTAGWSAAGNIGGAMAGGAASGASTAAMTGGDVGKGALIGMATAGGIAALGEASMYMRRETWEQSQINPTGANANGPSAGVNGDGHKLAGCRWPCTSSWLGGAQGGQGYFFGIPYPKGGVVDYVLENFAGPHDYFNNPIWYDEIGNLNQLSGLLNGVGNTMNWLNVALASPFAASSMIQPYTGTLMPAISVTSNEKK